MSFISSSTSSLLDKRPHLPLPNEHDRHPKSSSNSSREDGEVAKLSIQLRLQAEPIWKSGSSLTFPCAAFYDGAIAGHARRLERTSRNGLKVGAEALPVTAWCRVIEESCGKVAPARKFGTAVTPAVTLTSISSAAMRLMSLILLVPLPRLERGTPRSTIPCSLTTPLNMAAHKP